MTVYAMETISIKQLRQFGFLVGGIFAGIFGLLLPLIKHRPLPLVPLSIGIVLVVLGLTAPVVLRPVYRFWMAIGGILGKVNGTILLTIIYFLFFVPLGIVKRLKGKDPMCRGFDPNASSYRIPSQALTRNSMEEVF
jgi:hypothetical protein